MCMRWLRLMMDGILSTNMEQKDPIAYTKLNKGDVYKIGETQHPKTRYSQVRLDEARINRSKATAVAFDADGNIIPAGVKMKPISQGGTKKLIVNWKTAY